MLKKLYKILVIFGIFILTGCGKSIMFNVNTNNITNIIYDGVNIASSDFEGIVDKLNNKSFESLEIIDVSGKKLAIDTNEHSYEFEILDNFIVYNENNKKYFTKIEKISNYFKDTISKYENKDFFTIGIYNDYDIDNSDYLIKLNDSNKYIIINTLLNIYDFEVITNNYVNKTQNKINKIENNKIICIETDKLNNIIITFKNPYNYIVNITYNNGFITKINKPNI